MLTIIKPGLLDTVQDLGRYGYQKHGVVTSGAMDKWAHRIANLLVGNEEDASTIESTITGPEIQFAENSLIALCGGEFCPTINGIAVPMWRPVLVKKNHILKIGHTKRGCRIYLAVGGGFDVPLLMNSRSTYMRAKIGGFQGRPLKKEDKLLFGNLSAQGQKIQETLNRHLHDDFQVAHWSISRTLIPKLAAHQEIRVTTGNQFDLFSKSYITHFFNEPFTVSPQADRMGYRLAGRSPSSQITEELISEAVTFGSIQVPPDGKPIILTADCQTTGGYPKIAQISSCDFSYIAQAKPGDTFSFTKISLKQSQKLFLKKEQQLQQLKTSITLKVGQ